MTPASEKKKLGIIAGGGELPIAVAEAAIEAAHSVFVIGVEGTTSKSIEKFDHAWVRSGAVGKTLSLLKENGCRDLVLIGPMTRPKLREFRPDFGALKLLPRILLLLRRGDDGLLSGIVQYLEEEHGFNILPAEKFASSLIVPEGVSSKRSPSEADLADIDLAIEVVRERGRRDLGQGAIVASGLTLDVEDEAGTDAMLLRVAQSRETGDRSGVLVKLPKPGQERRVDLPTLGVQTVENAAAAGLAGIAYETAGALFADFDQAVLRADELGLFIVGLPKGTGESEKS